MILISQSDVEVQPHVISARYTNTGYLPSSKAVAASAEHTVNLAKHQPPKLQHVKAQPVAQRSSPSEHSTSSTSAVPQVLHSVDTRQLLRKATDSDNDPDNFAIDIINVRVHLLSHAPINSLSAERRQLERGSQCLGEDDFTSIISWRFRQAYSRSRTFRTLIR